MMLGIQVLKSKKWISFFALIFVSISLFIFSLRVFLTEDLLKENISTLYYSQEENLLFHQSSDLGKFREWNQIENFPEYLINAVIASEDKRYYYHPGIDPLSLVRILKHFIATGRVIGGGSTIPQQLSRILNPSWKEDHKLIRKCKEISFALAINLRYTKKSILEAYLNSVSIRNNSEGFSIAAKRYFGKNIKYLSKEESIGLVVLMRNNYPSEESFHRRVQELSQSLGNEEEVNLGYLESRLLFKNPGSLRNEEIGAENYHFTEWMKHQFPNFKGNIISTISSELNRTIYEIVLSELRVLERYKASNASVVVFEIDPKDKTKIRLVSMIGSRNFFDYDAGQVNGSIAYRDAGSILKPFLYAQAIDSGLLKPNSILEDKEFRIHSENASEIFIPKNADLKFWGDVTMAEALANSRNIPAYRTIDTLGTLEFRKFLEKLGFHHLNRSTDYYGHGLAMGTGGASLFNVTYAYSAFVLDGILPIIEIGSQGDHKLTVNKVKRIISSETAEEISGILRDSDLRKKAFSDRGFLNFPYPIGLKTGTSKDFRNSWTIGFSDRYIVGTWVGNFSGGSMENVTGNWGAGRIFQSIMRHLVSTSPVVQSKYHHTDSISVCRKTGMRARETCPMISIKMRKSFHPSKVCDLHSDQKISKSLEILSPSNGQIFYLSNKLPLDSQKIPFQFRNLSESERYQILLDESTKINIQQNNKLGINLSKGRHKIEIKNKDTVLQKVEFTVQFKD